MMIMMIMLLMMIIGKVDDMNMTHDDENVDDE